MYQFLSSLINLPRFEDTKIQMNYPEKFTITKQFSRGTERIREEEQDTVLLIISYVFIRGSNIHFTTHTTQSGA